MLRVSSTLPRAVIVSGLTEAQLISLMNVCKKSGMQPALWACLTPVSETWPLQQLLTELAREREAMQKKSRSSLGFGYGMRGLTVLNIGAEPATAPPPVI